MRIKFHFLFLLLFCPLVVLSQGDYWGVKGGLNLTKVSKVQINNSIKPGVHFGLFANFHIEMIDKLSFQHEILFSTKGISLNLNDSLAALNGGNHKYSKSFNYIDLPWMLNYHFSDVFFVSLGIQPSIYAHFKKPKYETVLYNKDNVNTIDVGWLIGASFLLPNNFGFGVRFNGGITKTFDIDDKTRNYSMQFYLVYAVNKKAHGRKRRR